MSDMIDMYCDLGLLRRVERQRLGVACPICGEKLPRAQPAILLPGRVCRAHKPHYRDPRPEPSVADWNKAMDGTGCIRVEPETAS